jgi:hypothetical protein
MANYDLTKGTASTPVHSSRTGARVPYLVENVIDFALLNSDAGALAADVIRMIDIPAETIVLDAGMEVVSVITSGGSATFDLQTGASANKWVAAHSTLTAGYAAGVLTSAAGHGTAGTNGGFTTTDTIDILVNTATATAGTMRVWALFLDVSGFNESSTATQSQYDTAV